MLLFVSNKDNDDIVKVFNHVLRTTGDDHLVLESGNEDNISFIYEEKIYVKQLVDTLFMVLNLYYTNDNVRGAEFRYNQYVDFVTETENIITAINFLCRFSDDRLIAVLV